MYLVNIIQEFFQNIAGFFSNIHKFFVSIAMFCSNASVWFLGTIRDFFFSHGSESIRSGVDNAVAETTKQTLSNTVITENATGFVKFFGDAWFCLRLVLCFLIIMFLVNVLAKIIVIPKQRKLRRALNVSRERRNKLQRLYNDRVTEEVGKQASYELYNQLNKD